MNVNINQKEERHFIEFFIPSALFYIFSAVKKGSQDSDDPRFKSPSANRPSPQPAYPFRMNFRLLLQR